MSDHDSENEALLGVKIDKDIKTQARHKWSDTKTEPPSKSSHPLLPISSSTPIPNLIDSPTPSPSASSDNHQSERIHHSIKCLCINLSHLSPPVRFGFLSCFLLFFFMLNSYVEEYLFKFLPSFKFGWYLTFFELLCFSIFAVIERSILGDENVGGAGKGRIFSHRATLWRHAIVAIAMTLSRGLTNVSLQYLNYPTQVIFKSMKLLTVMIGSVIYLRHSFTLLEYLSAGFLVLSACLFSLGDVDVAPAHAGSSFGFVIVLLSLVADSMHSNTQEALVREHGATTLEAMLFTNAFAAASSFIVIIISGEFWLALEYCANNPIAYILFVIRAIVIYGGVLCYVILVKSSGAALATAITTIRKILTIIASFIFFPKPFTIKYLWGFLSFSVAVTLSILILQQQQQNKKNQNNNAKTTTNNTNNNNSSISAPIPSSIPLSQFSSRSSISGNSRDNNGVVQLNIRG